MKRTTIIIIMLAFAVSVNAQFTKFGGGLGYSTGYHFHDQQYSYTKSFPLNIFAKGIYELNLPFHISPSFTFFIPTFEKSTNFDITNKSTLTTMMFDLNAHYVFNSLDQFEFFALAGLDVMYGRLKYVTKYSGTAPTTYKSVENDNAFGLNLGVGSYMKMTEQIDLFLEAKYVLSKYGQFMLNAGVLINLQWLAKNENPGI
ncbi:MAG: outer membrane beta-barrel protein [Bacteroidales bacterium]